MRRIMNIKSPIIFILCRADIIFFTFSIFPLQILFFNPFKFYFQKFTFIQFQSNSPISHYTHFYFVSTSSSILASSIYIYIFLHFSFRFCLFFFLQPSFLPRSVFRLDVSRIRAPVLPTLFCNSSGAKKVFFWGRAFIYIANVGTVLTPTVLSSLQLSASVTDLKVNLSRLPF